LPARTAFEDQTNAKARLAVRKGAIGKLQTVDGKGRKAGDRAGAAATGLQGVGENKGAPANNRMRP
jgi:hypothetical protein